MYTYIEQAPTVCRAILDTRDERVGGLVQLFCARPYRRLHIVASGSSYNIAMTMRDFLQAALGIEVTVGWPMSYILYDHLQPGDTFVLCLSQSGKSTNTIAAVEKAVERGNTVAVLTCNANAPIDAAGGNVFEYGSGTDDYYVGKGFPSSCTYLALFGIMAASMRGTLEDETRDALIDALSTEIGGMQDAFEKAQAFCAEHINELVRARRIMTVGIGGGYGLALEGALKLNEMTGIAANAYEMEEFVHGPTYEIRKDHVVMLVDLGGPGHERMMQLSQALHLLTDHVFVIAATEGYDEYSLELGTSSGRNVGSKSDLAAIRAIIPFQTAAEAICSKLDMLSYNLVNFDFEQEMKTKA
ncbi:SIS domain-containing protein [[Collinsella] massiliensis]|uniref:SIS domain-containing protein n=1 Tax=[Collinsella] massiliensis TaxID=1232426 RepID=A0A1Y3XPR5_9ACTN|nr:SIS domain-containing protein [[Collinsella] massiliensis]OUN87554.1 hypothetical protein B5G02_07335 [[Collinsella] massiliensis]